MRKVEIDECGKITKEQIFKDLAGCIKTPIEKPNPELIKSMWKEYPSNCKSKKN